MKYVLCTFLILIIFSCKENLKFDSKTWKASGGESIMLDTRKRMVNDLIASEVLLNKNVSQIKGIIGYSSRLQIQKEGVEYYAVHEKYDWDIDPVEMIFLEIHFDENGVSNSVNLYISK